MKYRQASQRLAAYRKRIAALRRGMRRVQRQTAPEPVDDYTFTAIKGPVRLSQLFGNKRDLIVIHNMGSDCPHCTLWADGYNGLYLHLASRAAFVVISPDSPAAQQRFARSRGWRFPMLSHQGTTFAADMGYRSREGRWRPGVSAFRRTREGIVRLSDTGFSPGDDFCAAWHFFDLFPDGAAGWQAASTTPASVADRRFQWLPSESSHARNGSRLAASTWPARRSSPASATSSARSAASCRG